MSARILIILQLVCSSLSLSIITVPPDDDLTSFSSDDRMSQERHDREVELLRTGNATGFGMYDRKGVFRPITTEENPSMLYKGRIIFRLYTRKNPTNGQELRSNDTEMLKNSNFNSADSTVLITHGWLSNEKSEACYLIRDAYLNKTDYNVIVVDWSIYSSTINYIDAADKTLLVGKEVAEMIKFLWDNGLCENRTNLIGHSLGAHVMGIAGYKLRPRKVQDIIGLDPALPMFATAKEGEALSKEDARRVLIIHTNGGFLGYACPKGHVDFFPNGGKSQVGCCEGLFRWATCAPCSHERAYKFFAESLMRRFNSTQCPHYASFLSGGCASDPIAPMGGLQLEETYVPNGTYYLTTGKNEPFSENVIKPPPSENVEPLDANHSCDKPS